jgi:hypothetical protein
MIVIYVLKSWDRIVKFTQKMCLYSEDMFIVYNVKESSQI